MPPVKYRLLQVPGSSGIFSAARFSTSHATACAAISTVISLHCVSLDSIRLPRLRAGRGKKLDTRKSRVNIGVSSLSRRSPFLSFFLSSSSSSSSGVFLRLPLRRSTSVLVRGCKSVSQIKSEH